ncbi:MAG: hypothetical protein BGO43_00060 [Gammaproteobacteria bacterium 39-13]|nr:hypothetical protein [Gammaproteobacteria bacterium]OJV96660.1 MAG: hypothetical protein BGO43_00060 [Gammaproteobacteria bacterium 39-13]
MVYKTIDVEGNVFIDQIKIQNKYTLNLDDIKEIPVDNLFVTTTGHALDISELRMIYKTLGGFFNPYKNKEPFSRDELMKLLQQFPEFKDSISHQLP